VQYPADPRYWLPHTNPADVADITVIEIDITEPGWLRRAAAPLVPDERPRLHVVRDEWVDE
jgi:hypothetical protein